MRELIFAVSIISYLILGLSFWRWSLKKTWGAELAEEKPFNVFFALYAIGYWPIAAGIVIMLWCADRLLEKSK